jgi:hypothetical protein
MDNTIQYLCLAQDICKLAQPEQYRFLKVVEAYFDEESETPLGDFLDGFVQLLVKSGNSDSLHQEVEDLLEEHDLDEEMVACVGETMQGFYNEYFAQTVMVY